MPSRPSKAPDEIKQEELLYVKNYLMLMRIIKKKIDSIDDLKQYRTLMGHFNRQRICFYQAEALKVFERDTIPEGINAFDEVKDQVYHGIIDTVYSNHEDGFQGLKQ